MAVRPAMTMNGIGRTHILNVDLLCRTASHVTPTHLASLFSQHLGLPCRDMSSSLIVVEGRPTLTDMVAAWDSILAGQSGTGCDRTPIRIQKRQPNTLLDSDRRDGPSPLTGPVDSGP